jgi:hypothetical protein
VYLSKLAYPVRHGALLAFIRLHFEPKSVPMCGLTC